MEKSIEMMVHKMTRAATWGRLAGNQPTQAFHLIALDVASVCGHDGLKEVALR